jgi:hypothetical protein
MDLSGPDKIIAYLYSIIPAQKTQAQLLKEVFNNDAKVPLPAIINHLLTDGYLVRWEYQAGKVNPSKDEYLLSFVAIAKQTDAAYSGKGLYEAKKITEDAENKRRVEKEEIELKVAKAESWPKRHWLIMIFVAFFLGIIADMGKELFKRKLDQDAEKAAPNNSKTIDSVRKNASPSSKK